MTTALAHDTAPTTTMPPPEAQEPPATAESPQQALGAAQRALAAARQTTASAERVAAEKARQLADAQAAAEAAQQAYERGDGPLEAAATADAAVRVLERAQLGPQRELAAAQAAERAAAAECQRRQGYADALAAVQAAADALAELEALRAEMGAALDHFLGAYREHQRAGTIAQHRAWQLLAASVGGPAVLQQRSVQVLAQVAADGADPRGLGVDFVARPGGKVSVPEPVWSSMMGVPPLPAAQTRGGGALDWLVGLERRPAEWAGE